VRETWYQNGSGTLGNPVHYKATVDEAEREVLDADPYFKWRPSIHMPRWASRLTLEITDIRAERVQDICRADITAEGIKVSLLERLNFEELWNSINEKRGYGWDVNPWVWVVNFVQITEKKQ
jgi:hypothetical protein